MQASGSGGSQSQDFGSSFDVVYRSVDRLTEEPDREELWSDATQLALSWSLKRTAVDEGALGEESGTGHWYCERGCKGVNQGWGETAEDVEFVKYFRVQAFLLRLFSFRTKEEVAAWRAGWEKAVRGCIDCAIGHARAEEMLIHESAPLDVLPAFPSVDLTCLS